jgi:hypothetical protein
VPEAARLEPSFSNELDSENQISFCIYLLLYVELWDDTTCLQLRNLANELDVLSDPNEKPECGITQFNGIGSTRIGAE